MVKGPSTQPPSAQPKTLNEGDSTSASLDVLSKNTDKVLNGETEIEAAVEAVQSCRYCCSWF